MFNLLGLQFEVNQLKKMLNIKSLIWKFSISICLKSAGSPFVQIGLAKLSFNFFTLYSKYNDQGNFNQ